MSEKIEDKTLEAAVETFKQPQITIETLLAEFQAFVSKCQQNGYAVVPVANRSTMKKIIQLANNPETFDAIEFNLGHNELRLVQIK